MSAARNAQALATMGGCTVACAIKALETAGIRADVYVVVMNLGIEKDRHFSDAREEAAQGAGAVAEALDAGSGGLRGVGK